MTVILFYFSRHQRGLCKQLREGDMEGECGAGAVCSSTVSWKLHGISVEGSALWRGGSTV